MRLKLLPGLAAAVLLLTPLFLSAQQDAPGSKTVNYPADHPLLSISIPDGWTTPGASIASMPLLILPPKGASGKVTIHVEDNVTDPQATLKKQLDRMEGAGIKWDSKGDEGDLNGMKTLGAKGSGTKDGENWRVAQYVFSPDGKHYFSLSLQAKEADVQTMGPAIEAIMNSIKPVTAPAKERQTENTPKPNPSSAPARDAPNLKTVSFPADAPFLSISFPTDWRTKELPKGLLVGPKGGGGDLALDAKKDGTDPQAELTKIMEAQGAEVKWDSQPEKDTLNGMPSFDAKGSGTENGEKWRYFASVFSPDGKHYFSLIAEGKEGDESTNLAIEAVMKSVKPLTPPAKTN